MIWRTFLIGVSFLVLLGVAESAPAQSAVTTTPRKVYVLHSGMHLILAPANKNLAVETLRQMLCARGVPEADIVPLDCPYPTASWSDLVPRDGLLLYLASTDPASKASQDAYQRLHKQLQLHKVTSDDDLVWIGHSAGGQMGMTMAHLAHNLDKYPDLARKTRPYHFAMVVTLGSAVGSNPVPDNVKLRHYYSAGDALIHLLSKHGNVLTESMNSRVCFRLCHDVRANARIRVFHDVEHGSWYEDEFVLDCILREFELSDCPPWRRTQADLGAGIGLAQLLAQTLQSHWHISLEEHLP